MTGDPYTAEIRGRLIGRGVADMKAALAAQLLPAEVCLESTREPSEVILGFVVDEEHGAGTKAKVGDGIDATTAIGGELIGLRGCLAQQRVLRVRITCPGEHAHAGTPDEGANTIPTSAGSAGDWTHLTSSSGPTTTPRSPPPNR